MRILILAQQWEPEEGTPQRRWGPLVEALVERGHQVVVVTPPPHYPGGLLTSDDPEVQVGAVAKGARGEVVVRCNFAEHSQSLSSRIIDQATTALSTIRVAHQVIQHQRADIILATAPPLPSAYAASWVAWTRKIPYILDLRDVWPDLLQYMNEWGPRADQKRRWSSLLAPAFAAASTVASRALNFSLRHASGITTTTPSFAELLRERGFRPVLNLRNLASVLDSPVAPLETRDDGELRILYVGTTGRAQGLHSALDAIERLGDRGVKVKMRIVGSGAALNFLKEEAKIRNLPIEFLGRLPHAKVSEHYEWADTSLVHLRDWKPLQYTVPSKLYESLSAGRHVTVAADGESARIVEETQVGIAVPAMDPVALADAWEYLSKNPELMDIKNQGTLWLDARESQKENAEKFANFVERCANESP